jgi:hypothetical protein
MSLTSPAMTSTSGPASSGTTPVADAPGFSAPTIDIVRSLVGAVFLGVFAYWRPPHPLAVEWAELLLLVAVLVIIPLTIGIFLKSVTPGTTGLWALIEQYHLSAGALLIGAYLMPASLAVACLVLPWLAMTFFFALAGLVAIRERSARNLGAATISIGFLFLAVGGVWAVIERSGYRPWGFESNIEILTAVHFHYAGFVLLSCAGWAAKEFGTGRVAKLACLAAIVGVPLTAAGILTTKLGHGTGVEIAGALVMAVAGALVACAHLMLAGRKQYTPLVRALWTVAAASLFAGMMLAALYGLRTIYPIALLDIPHMRAIHGTLNAVGFGLCAVCGWRSRFRRPRTIAA